MSLQMNPQQRVLYQADNNTAQNIRAYRDHLHNICRHHVHKYVRIETLDGQIAVGRIVNCDKGLLNIAVKNNEGHHGHGSYGRGFGYNDELILTLVLYELLVITLLYT
ncbi:hypothetical protein D3C74_235480 [compost metagenome]